MEGVVSFQYIIQYSIYPGAFSYCAQYFSGVSKSSSLAEFENVVIQLV